MKASIIIPTKDKLSRLFTTLKALENQIDGQIEVLVIFDGCKDITVKEFKKINFKFEPISIVLPQNVGRARARNFGIHNAKGEIIIFLDDDRLVSPNYVINHINKHKGKDVAVIGERLNIDYSEKELGDFLKSEHIDFNFAEIEKRSYKEENDLLKKIGRRFMGQLLEKVTFTTGNSSVKRSDLIKIGSFDENFSGWGMEDVDLGYRLSRIGVKIIRDYSLVNYHLTHPVNKSRQKDEYYKNFNYFIKKIQDDKKSIYFAKFLTIFM